MGNFNILVTGSKGQLGTALKEKLDGLFGKCVTYLDYEDCDITDVRSLRGLMNNCHFTHIINCAAYTAVDKAETEKSLCNLINNEGVKNIASVASDTGTRVLHISTDYVFDGQSTVPYTEGDKVNPLNQYGTTKRSGETALLALAPESIILRTGWLYSPFGHNFVKTMLSIAENRKELGVVYDQIGTPTYACDLADTIATILQAKAWIPGIYNYANEGTASWYDFADAIFNIRHSLEKEFSIPTLKPLLTGEYPQAAERPHYSVLNKSKIKATYGVSIRHWREALAECIGRLAGKTNQGGSITDPAK